MEGKKKMITVTVRDKIATGDGSKIVCGNSDYIVHFDLDEEWSAYEAKTARFKWGGKYEDIVFKGNECPLPVLKNTLGLKVGIFAGDLRSTTDAVFDCNLSTLCESGAPADPSPDVYAQLMELINAGVNPEQVEAAVLKYLDENPITSDYTLPVANAATLGGVKPTAATADMTQPVGVDAAGALFTAPGASGGDSSAFRLVNTIETTEEVANITLNQTDDGEPWNFQEVIMHIHVPTATTNSYVTPKVNGITSSPSFYVWSANVFHPTNASDSTITILACGDACRMNLQGRTNLGGSPYSGEAWAMGEGKFKTITEFVFAGFNISIPVGCKMLVFAR